VNAGGRTDLIPCRGCGEPTPTRTSRCWRCGYPAHRSLLSPASGLSLIASTVVIVAVFAVVLVGIVVIAQRERVVAADAAQQAAAEDAEGQAEELALLARLESQEPTPSPTPLPADTPGYHVVHDGESLFSVAGAFGVTANQLVFWNAAHYPTLRSTPALEEGWVLAISGPSLPTPVPTPTPQPRPASTQEPQIAAASIPDFGPGSFPASDRVTVTLYDVAGTSPATIHASIEQGGPWSDWLQGNAQAHVVTSLTYNFHFEDWGDGGCVVVAETASPVSFQYEVRLPRWVDAESASRSTVDWWLETIHETVWHEGHHIELYESVLPAMNEAVLTGSCGSVTADLQSLIYGANRANCEFDLAEYGYQHGLTLESCLSS
jgi:LysM repeat protein